MKMKTTDNGLVYQSDEGVIYVLSPLSDCACVLGVTGVPLEDPKGDIEAIFDTPQLSKLVMFIEEHNEDFIRYARRTGFKQEGRLKKACTTGDYLVFGQYRTTDAVAQAEAAPVQAIL